MLFGEANHARRDLARRRRWLEQDEEPEGSGAQCDVERRPELALGTERRPDREAPDGRLGAFGLDPRVRERRAQRIEHEHRLASQHVLACPTRREREAAGSRATRDERGLPGAESAVDRVVDPGPPGGDGAADGGAGTNFGVDRGPEPKAEGSAEGVGGLECGFAHRVI